MPGSELLVLSSRIFSSAASAAAVEAPLLAGEAREAKPVRMCIRVSRYFGLRMWRLFAANRLGPRPVCPAVAATRPGKVVNGPLTSFLGGGCAIGHLRREHQTDGQPTNAQTGRDRS